VGGDDTGGDDERDQRETTNERKVQSDDFVVRKQTGQPLAEKDHPETDPQRPGRKPSNRGQAQDREESHRECGEDQRPEEFARRFVVPGLD
tara:strand:+ start:2047 stop:2319 length:273 start_codon:yes stop_codon:yes gene_type:complete